MGHDGEGPAHAEFEGDRLLRELVSLYVADAGHEREWLATRNPRIPQALSAMAVGFGVPVPAWAGDWHAELANALSHEDPIAAAGLLLKDRMPQRPDLVRRQSRDLALGLVILCIAKVIGIDESEVIVELADKELVVHGRPVALKERTLRNARQHFKAEYEARQATGQARLPDAAILGAIEIFRQLDRIRTSLPGPWARELPRPR